MSYGVDWATSPTWTGDDEVRAILKDIVGEWERGGDARCYIEPAKRALACDPFGPYHDVKHEPAEKSV